MKKLFLMNPLKYIILAILINLLLFTLFFCFITPRYQTNDDSTMESFASGTRTGQPSEYLIFINILIGKLLVFLYNNFLTINWYPVLFYLIHFLSMIVICYCLLLKKGFAFGFSIFLLIFSFFELFMLTNLQFTTTSSVAAISGVMLFLSYLDSKGYKFYIAMAASIFLFVLSGLIRQSMSYLILAFFIIILLFKFVKKPVLKIPVFIIIVTILFASSYFYNVKYYQKDPEWKFYTQYNKLRSKISDYPQSSFGDKTIPVYKTVGWSKNDVNMFKSWFFMDLELYSLEKLQYAANNISNENGPAETLKVLKKAFNNLDLKIRFFMLFFLIFLLAAIIKNRNKYLFFTLLPPFLVSIFFSYSSRLPDRIFIPIIFYAVLTSIFFIEHIGLKPYLFRGYKVLKIISVFVCVVTAISIFTGISFESRINIVEQKEFESTLNKMKKEDRIYIRWGAAPLHNRMIFFYIRDSLRDLKYVRLGWTTHSPVENEIKDRYSIENIYLDLVNRDDIYVLCYEQQAVYFKKFMQEHYGVTVSSSQISEFDKGYFINKFYIPSNPFIALFKRAYFYCGGMETGSVELIRSFNFLQSDKQELNEIAYGLKKIFHDNDSIIAGYSNKEFISFLYLIILDRKADTSGLAKWLQEMENGSTQPEIIDSFINSFEFQRKYAESLAHTY